MLDTAISHRELLVALKRTLALQSHTKLPRAAVALSGGVDSLALYLLLREYYRRSGQGNDLAALTVDHALRPESGVEAKQVQARVQDARVCHEVLSSPGYICKCLARLRDHRMEHRGIDKLARQGRSEASTAA
jgi:tRNA(Ile)-lysidine synthase TilS/MesJ